MKIEDLVDYISDMNKDRTHRESIQRKGARSYSDSLLETSPPRISLTGLSQQLPVAEVKDHPPSPLSKRTHTVAEFNSMRRRKWIGDSDVSVLQPLFKQEKQFPPISAMTYSGLYTGSRQASSAHHSEYSTSSNAIKSVQELMLEKSKSRNSTNKHSLTDLAVRGVMSQTKSSVDSIRTNGTASAEEKPKHSIMVGSHVSPKKLSYHLYMPNMYQTKQVSFSERVAFIDTYALEEERPMIVQNKDQHPLLLTTQNLEILEKLHKQPAKATQTTLLEKNNNFVSNNKPVKEVRLVNWLKEMQAEQEMAADEELDEKEDVSIETDLTTEKK